MPGVIACRAETGIKRGMSEKGTEQVLLIHGLWHRAWTLRTLAGRLRKAGFAPHRFSYPTRRYTLPDLAARLHEHIGSLASPSLHFVAHSMGGLAVLRMLNEYRDLPPGRVVLLGSPVHGSRVARRVGRLPGSGILFGRSAATLKTGYSIMPAGREVGMIRGTVPLGLGLISGGFDEPNDGTVAASETRLDDVTDSIGLPTTHTGLIYSSAVAHQAIHFLHHGRFERRDSE